MLPSLTRNLIVAWPPPFTRASTFVPLVAVGFVTARLSKSLKISPCTALTRRWKAASPGRYAHALPCAIFASEEKLLFSHQSYDKMRLPRRIARSKLVEQLRAN